MAVCLRIHIDHNKTSDQLFEISNLILHNQKLFDLLLVLYEYESIIGLSPKSGYKKWSKEFETYDDYTNMLTNDGAVTISNNVFSLHIAKHAVIIDHWTKLGYFCDDIKLQGIFLQILQNLTDIFSSTTIIYTADSAYKTELIAFKLYEGESFLSIVNWLKDEKIRSADSISDIKKQTKEKYYETDGCYIQSL